MSDFRDPETTDIECKIANTIFFLGKWSAALDFSKNDFLKESVTKKGLKTINFS